MQKQCSSSFPLINYFLHPHFLIRTIVVLTVSCMIMGYTITVYHVMAQPGGGLRADITGQYSNPTYGIINFEIPEGWYASEGMFGDKGISISMHPGTSDEFLQRLTTGQVNATIPIMDLAVVDKEERQLRMQNAPASSSLVQCTELQPNSTATIEGKVFNISTMKCTTGNQQSQQGEQLGIPDFSSTEVFKRYEYESPNRIYAVQLTLSSDRSPQNAESNLADIEKIAPALDNAIQTLRLNE
jgi:hypothetical protein